MREHLSSRPGPTRPGSLCGLGLVVALLPLFAAPVATADTEDACAAFSQATNRVNTDLAPFTELTRKEGWTYTTSGMAEAIQKASSGLAEASRDVEAKVVDTEPGPAPNALRHYSATATALGQKISRKAPFAEVATAIEAYNAAVHTANGACGLGIGG